MRITYLKIGPARDAKVVPIGWGLYPQHGVTLEAFRLILANLRKAGLAW